MPPISRSKVRGRGGAASVTGMDEPTLLRVALPVANTPGHHLDQRLWLSRAARPVDPEIFGRV